ncbi:MAG: Precorrin-6Y C(5,15)-methyltransferase [decarboxylating], partial [uncultured Solirubrobacteraceae bacterium]
VVSAGSEIVVVGIGADGWPGLGEGARQAVRTADAVVGSSRQLELLPEDVGAPKRAWPSPMEPLIEELVTRSTGTTCVLASGDPMLHGIGASLVRRAGARRVRVHPHPSAFAIACARLGWPSAEVELVSAVAREPEVVVRALQPGRRIVAYVTGAGGAATLSRVLSERGFGRSRFVVLEQLGGAAERILETTAAGWGSREADPLHAVAIEVVAGPGAAAYARVPGLPDAAYASDGQLTKRHVRAVTLAALAPGPGELLWDVGAGSGSIAIEWLRAEPTARATALEAREDRAARISANALDLGVPGLDVRIGRAPAALEDLPTPDAIFIGGGITTPGLLAGCWAALGTGGRIVANTVTLEGEQAVAAARAVHGGTLTRIEISHAEPVGGFTGWRAQMPVVQWSAIKGVGG